MYRDNGFSYNDRVEVFINTSASLIGASSLGTISRYNNTSPAATANTWNQYTFNYPGRYTGSINYLIFKGISAVGITIFV